MVEKTEASTKNGQSRYTGNIGYTGYRTKTHKLSRSKKTTEKMSNTNSTKNRVWTHVFWKTVPASYYTSDVLRK